MSLLPGKGPRHWMWIRWGLTGARLRKRLLRLLMRRLGKMMPTMLQRRMLRHFGPERTGMR